MAPAAQTPTPTPSCSSEMGTVFKQVGNNIVVALSNCLKGALTVTNITKCLEASEEKIGSVVNRKIKSTESKCNGDSDSNSDNASTKTIKANSTNASDKAVKITPIESKQAKPIVVKQAEPSKPQYVNYPPAFNKSSAFTSGDKVVKWGLAEKSSVSQRWAESHIKAAVAVA